MRHGLSRSTERAARVLLSCLALVAVATSCGSPSNGAAASEPVSSGDLVARFGTGGDVLYPPELWGVLGVSTDALIRHHEVQTALGIATTPLPTVAALYDDLRAELDSDVAAASTITGAGLLDDGSAPPWATTEPAGWTSAALAARSIDDLWQAFNVRDALVGLPSLDGPTVDWLVGVAGGSEIVPSRQATIVLRELAPASLSRIDDSSASALRSPRDAAWLLFDAAVNEATSPSDVDELAVELAVSAAPTDDVVLSLTVRAFVAAGDLDRAASVAATFDERRLLPGGEVLEPVLFNGSAGSTFRMLRHAQVADRLSSDLTDGDRVRLRDKALADVGIDTSHRLAGLASAVLLDPGSVTPAERAEAISAALAAELPGPGPLGLEESVTWLAIAEAALVLDVPVAFPGFTPDAVAGWSAESPETVAPLLARLLHVVAETGSANAAGIDELTRLLAGHLASTPLADLDSTTLFAGSLAVHMIDGTWIHPVDDLLAERTLRTGDCLGGFDDFLRDHRDAPSACNVEATRYADLLVASIDAPN